MIKFVSSSLLSLLNILSVQMADVSGVNVKIQNRFIIEMPLDKP